MSGFLRLNEKVRLSKAPCGLKAFKSFDMHTDRAETELYQGSPDHDEDTPAAAVAKKRAE